MLHFSGQGPDQPNPHFLVQPDLAEGGEAEFPAGAGQQSVHLQGAVGEPHQLRLQLLVHADSLEHGLGIHTGAVRSDDNGFSVEQGVPERLHG